MFSLTNSRVVAYEDTAYNVRIAFGIAPSSPDRLEAESQQELSFYMTLVSGNSSLFAALPVLDVSTGRLSFTPEPNANGRAVWDVVLVDNGGAEKRAHTRGQNVSAVRQLVVDVMSVNDPPSFSHKSNITLLANGDVSSSFLEPGVVYNWKKGPPDEEASQNVTFSVQTDPSLPASLWASKPSITANGSLSVRIASSITFVTTLTIVLRDNGGTLYGGRDTFSSNITLNFVARPEPVTNLAILQRIEKTLDITWSHVDVGRAPSTPGRAQTFIVQLVRDCSAISSSTELAACNLFKLTTTINISQCSISSSCSASFSGLETTLRYVVSVETQNQAGLSAPRRLGAIVLRPPSVPASANITQLATLNSNVSILALSWAR